MRSLGVGGLAACAVVAVAGFSAGSAGAGAAAPVCVGTGLLATQGPGTNIPVAAAPALLGPDRAGTSLESSDDAATGLAAGAVSLGVAGCVDPQGTPGGTTLRVGAWSLFGGAVRGASLRADLVPRPADGAGWWLRTREESLVVEGRQVTVAPGDRVGVGNWGTLVAKPEPAPLPGSAPLRWWRAELELDLTRAHGGFPAGTSFLIGWVAADREPRATPALALPATTTTSTTSTTSTTGPPPASTSPQPRPASTKTKVAPGKPAKHPTARHKATKRAAKRATKRATKPTAPLAGRPLGTTPSIGSGLHTFPVVGDAAWGDTYGAHRSDVRGGWHHGDDLFAPLGTPVVAVADGTVFAVGWNSVGGWRLWLVDAEGNQYYYAHLSGYSAIARNNHHVRRGQVLGFVGNTGDAVTTWPHVHFEVHPSGLLYLGYDGAVDPTRYLAGWTRLTRIADVPPPVALPPGAPRGQGAFADFRELLAIRPMKVARKLAPTASQPVHPTTRQLSTGATAVATPIARVGPGSHDGYAAVIAGVALLAGALLALGYTVRAGRAE